MGKSLIIERLLQDGFSKKFATYYVEHAEAETYNKAYDKGYVEWAHSNGFLAESAYAYGLNESNKKNYLSDYDYYKIWPLNNWSRIWVNDKLTLKLMLADKELHGFMPEYYYYTFNDKIVPLQDTPYKSKDHFYDFIELLKEKSEFACKPCNGAASVGFVHLLYKDGEFFINEKKTDEYGIKKFLIDNSNYVFTEYIRPSKQFSKYSPSIHTLRIVVLNKTGDDPKIVGGYLRLPNKFSGEANYVILDDKNIGKYNVFCEVDFETGHFGNAKLTFCDHVDDTRSHPDTDEIIDGDISNYEELKNKIKFICRKFSNLEYMGFDIGITDNGFKCMEINTHPGIKYMQIFRPFNLSPILKEYFDEKILEIDNMYLEEKIKRNSILR